MTGSLPEPALLTVPVHPLPALTPLYLTGTCLFTALCADSCLCACSAPWNFAQPIPQAIALLAAPTQDATPNSAGRARRQRGRDASLTDRPHSPPSRPHPYKRTISAPNHSFRASPPDQPQALCIVCLRKAHPIIGECREETLNDGEPAFSTRAKLGHLVDRQGKSLCVDFQLYKGCPSQRHIMRHRCSGCGSDQHGAVQCPRRPSN
jgi:hypothetical protein